MKDTQTEKVLAKGVAQEPDIKRASRVIPGGVLGFHKLMSPEQFPPFAAAARGVKIIDLHGREYIDFILGKGPIILGHCNSGVDRAVTQRLQAGNMLGVSTLDQVILAEKLLGFFPWHDKVRFHKTGSEACSAAVRLARAVTGKRWVISSGYHGWHEWCSPGEQGIPYDVSYFHDFNYNLDQLEAFAEKHCSDIAGVFVEPHPVLMSGSFYRQLREISDHYQCPLIFDEVKTGFRTHGGSVQKTVGIEADITVVSKAMTNGFCLSSVLGKSEYMDISDRLHISTTYDIEAIPYAAAIATLEQVDKSGFLEKLFAVCGGMVRALNEVFSYADFPAKAFEFASMFRIGFFSPEMETCFYSELARQGVMFYPYDNQFVCAAHDQTHIEKTRIAAEKAITTVLQNFPKSHGYSTVEGWKLYKFQNRKGFLQGTVGADGRRGEYHYPV